MTNVAASLYGGDGNGHVTFDFSPHAGAEFSFVVNVTNIDAHLLASDILSPTNTIKGRLNGHFVLTSGNTAHWDTCNGYGHADLRNGLLWQVPVFGIFSPVLNKIYPGLGNMEATEATNQMIMINGVIYTEALVIRTEMSRLQYSGKVDLQGRVDARVQAELLHGIWGVGPLFSYLFWPVSKVFEYSVTGTVQHPRIRPLYMKFLLHTGPHWREARFVFRGERV